MSFSMELPTRVLWAIERLQSAGHAAFVVGGAVRDTAMGRVAHDFDITTSATPVQTKSVFAGERVVTNGEKHGTVGVVKDGDLLEITTFRFDGEYSDGRHPDSVVFAPSIEDDLSRRDFTVNAMAYSEKTGLVDPFGGIEDIERGVIRAVGDPERRFSEDALRILRGFRFAARLGFDIDGATLRGMERRKEGLGSISAERIYSELYSLLATEKPSGTLALMHSTGVLDIVLRGVSVDFLAEDGFASIDKIRADAQCPSSDTAFLRIATLVSLSDRELSDIFGGVAFSSSRCRMVKCIREGALPPSASETDVRRFASGEGVRTTDEAHAMLLVASALGKTLRSGESAGSALETLQRVLARGDALSVSTLAIGGRELAQASLATGREIGKLLQALLDAVLEHPELNERETLLRLATDIAEKRKQEELL